MLRMSGFLLHDELAAGASVDRHVGDDGIVEIKAPHSLSHVGYLAAGDVPPEYRAQIRHLLWISGARWCDFVSFDDRFTGRLQLFVVRVERGALDTGGSELFARAFLAEVDRDVRLLRSQLGRHAGARDIVRCLDVLEGKRLDRQAAAVA